MIKEGTYTKHLAQWILNTWKHFYDHLLQSTRHALRHSVSPNPICFLIFRASQIPRTPSPDLANQCFLVRTQLGGGKCSMTTPESPARLPPSVPLATELCKDSSYSYSFSSVPNIYAWLHTYSLINEYLISLLLITKSMKYLLLSR